ncbi:MAG: hypothetical protein P4L91_17465 [Burkholderiaceae bacterium]|nr:hypothetical protein [Burkholderiaceae bacterium]
MSKHGIGAGFGCNLKRTPRFTIRSVQAGACAAILIAGMFSAVSAGAVGLGPMRLHSALGQPLKVEVGLVSALDSDLDKRCYKSKVQSLDGMGLGNTTIEIVFEGSAPMLVVTTAQSINEPALTMSVEYGCASRTRRDYQILLDLMPVTPAVTDSARVAAPVVAPEKRPAESPQLPTAPALTETPAVAKKPAHRRLGTEIKSDAGYAPATAAAAGENKELRHRKSAVKAFRSVLRLGGDESVDGQFNDTVGMRLKLSRSLFGANSASEEAASTPPQPQATVPAAAPVPAAVAADGSAVAPSSTALAAAPGAVQPTDAGLQELQAKIRVLEAETEELRKLNAKHLAALDTAQAAKQAGTPLLYLYFMLCASFVAIAWLVWRTRQIQTNINQSSWQQIVPEQEQADEFSNLEREDEDDRSLEQGEIMPVARNVTPLKQAPKAVPLDDEQVPSAFSAATPPQSRTAAAPADEHPEGEYKFAANVRSTLPNAEEILDEIQQAEFWMDMQQPERAIEILESNWGGERPSSPLPWLYLFDLYRTVGDREKYEDLTERFEHLFNGKVVPWGDGSALEHLRSLEDFPFLLKKIVQLWPTDDLVPFLENLLVDDRDGRRQGFDLAAYRDILFLTKIAYDIQESKNAAKASHDAIEWSVIQ